MFRERFGNKAADELEKVTHEMCYLFGRATRAVGICPPAYYADIVCTRARLHIGDVLNQTEKNMLPGKGGSVGPGHPGPGLDKAMRRTVHRNLANDMYYI